MILCKMCGKKKATVNEQMCADCYQAWQDEQAKIDKLVDSGHTHHCACRQVWGDGLSDELGCECGLVKPK